MEKTIIKSQLPGLIALAGESLAIYKNKWKALLFLVSISYLASVLIIAGAIALIQFFGVTTAFVSPRLWLLAAPLIIIVSFLAGTSWPQAAIIQILKDREASASIRQSLRQARVFALPYLWVAIILMPIILAGSFFFFFPAILFFVWFSFAGYIAVIENEKGFSALAKSAAYVKGYFLKVFLSLSMEISLFLIMALFLQLLENLPGGKIAYLIALLLIFPFFITFHFLIFENLKKIKRGNNLNVLPSVTQKNIVKIIFALAMFFIIFTAKSIIDYAPEIEEELKNYEEQTGQKLLPEE